MLVRALLIANLAVLGVGALSAATYDDDEGGGGVTRVETSVDLGAVADSTLAQTTMRFEMEITMADFAPGVDSISFPASGAMDLAAGRAETTMDMRSLIERLAEEFDEEVPADELAMFSEPMRVVQDQAVTYMCGGFFAAFGADCVSLDLAAFDPAFGEAFGSGTALGDQRTMIEALRGASNAEEIGREEVRGVMTTHYRAEQSLLDAIDEAPDPEALRDAFGRLGINDEMIEEPTTVEVWVDDAGLVRRMRQTMSGKALGIPGVDDDAVGQSTLDFFDFGLPVDIQIPVDAVDFADILSGIESEQFVEIGEEINTD